jgi:hypothetical protein
MVGDAVELLARHAESRMVVDVHGASLDRKGLRMEDRRWRIASRLAEIERACESRVKDAMLFALK